MVSLDPEQIRDDDQCAQDLRTTAALCAEFWDACRAAGLPDHVSATLVVDWHRAQIFQSDIEED